MDADMFGYVIRKDLAKMVAIYAQNVLGKQANTNIICEFDDMNNEPKETVNYTRTVCQLGLMGLEYDGTPAQNFMPNEFVDKAQFATIFSRLLR